jgi:hypothetical protein
VKPWHAQRTLGRLQIAIFVAYVLFDYITMYQFSGHLNTVPATLRQSKERIVKELGTPIEQNSEGY